MAGISTMRNIQDCDTPIWNSDTDNEICRSYGFPTENGDGNCPSGKCITWTNSNLRCCAPINIFPPSPQSQPQTIPTLLNTKRPFSTIPVGLGSESENTRRRRTEKKQRPEVIVIDHDEDDNDNNFGVDAAPFPPGYQYPPISLSSNFSFNPMTTLTTQPVSAISRAPTAPRFLPPPPPRLSSRSSIITSPSSPSSTSSTSASPPPSSTDFFTMPQLEPDSALTLEQFQWDQPPPLESENANPNVKNQNQISFANINFGPELDFDFSSTSPKSKQQHPSSTFIPTKTTTITTTFDPERTSFDCQSQNRDMLMGEDENAGRIDQDSCYFDHGSVPWSPSFGPQRAILKPRNSMGNTSGNGQADEKCYVFRNKNLCRGNANALNSNGNMNVNDSENRYIAFQNLPDILKNSMAFIDQTRIVLELFQDLDQQPRNAQKILNIQNRLNNSLSQWHRLWKPLFTSSQELNNDVNKRNNFVELLRSMDFETFRYVQQTINDQIQFVFNILDFVNSANVQIEDIVQVQSIDQIIKTFRYLEKFLNDLYVTLSDIDKSRSFIRQREQESKYVLGPTNTNTNTNTNINTNIPIFISGQESNTYQRPDSKIQFLQSIPTPLPSPFFVPSSSTISSNFEVKHPAPLPGSSIQNRYPYINVNTNTSASASASASGSMNLTPTPRLILSQIRRGRKPHVSSVETKDVLDREQEEEADETCLIIPPALLTESKKIAALGINRPRADRRSYLKPHQNAVVNWMVRPGVNGLLLYHTPGGGKTLSAIASIVAIFQAYPDIDTCYLLVRKSNVQDWIKEFQACNDQYFRFLDNIRIYDGNVSRTTPVATYYSPSYDFSNRGSSSTNTWKEIRIETNESFKSQYGFTKSKNMDIKTQVNPKCGNCIFVVDEVHYLKGEIKTSGGILAANALACARTAAKIMLLTGTPAPNDEYDWVNYIAMIDKLPTAPYSQKEWKNLSDDQKRAYFNCKISYFDCNWRTAPRELLKFFPTVTENTITLFMPPDYLAEYQRIENESLKIIREEAIDRERKQNPNMNLNMNMNAFGSMTKSFTPTNAATSTKRRRTRARKNRGSRNDNDGGQYGDDELSTAFYNHLRLGNISLQEQSPKIEWIDQYVVHAAGNENKKIIIFSNFIIATLAKIADRLDRDNNVRPVPVIEVHKTNKSKSKSKKSSKKSGTSDDDDNDNVDDTDEKSQVLGDDGNPESGEDLKYQRQSKNVNADRNRLYVEISGQMTPKMRRLGVARYLAKPNERVYLKTYVDKLLGKGKYEGITSEDSEYVTLAPDIWMNIPVRVGDDKSTRKKTSSSSKVKSTKKRATSDEKQNQWWDPVNIILLGPAGKEGLNLPKTNIEVAFETYWNFALLDQYEARGIRLGDEETSMRQKVQILRLFLVKELNRYIIDYLTTKYYDPEHPENLAWYLDPANIQINDILDSIPEEMSATDILMNYGIDIYLWRKSLIKYAKERHFVENIIKPSSIERNSKCWTYGQ